MLSSHLPLVERHEVDDARLLELAAAAVSAIETRARRGEELRSVVPCVLRTAFGCGTGSDDMDRAPERTPPTDEPVVALTADAARVDRVVTAVMEILSAKTSL